MDVPRRVRATWSRTIVDAAWLAAHLGAPDLVIADVRWLPGAGPAEVEAAFEAGHLPGAVMLDVDRDLAGPAGRGGRHPLPTPRAFATSMRRCGIGDDAYVVAYDDAGGSLAARLWWMLDALGHASAVLDGGSPAWGGPRSTGASSRPPASFTAAPWPAGAMVDRAEVARLLRTEAATVVDARSAERYRGEVEPIDAIAGHVPGAINVPWSDNLDPATGRFRSAADLRRRYEPVGAEGAVAMCGSGVTACHDLLAMRIAGLDRLRLFAGSWSGWIADPSRPVATGPEPGSIA
jgi:thiosulfate/3-mercaptopyruvate sulfurtransferase